MLPTATSRVPPTELQIPYRCRRHDNQTTVCIPGTVILSINTSSLSCLNDLELRCWEKVASLTGVNDQNRASTGDNKCQRFHVYHCLSLASACPFLSLCIPQGTVVEEELHIFHMFHGPGMRCRKSAMHQQ